MHLKSVMNREYSIQLVYQLSILIHNFRNFPVIELIYGQQRPGLPTAQWLLKLILQCISALLSAYSTLSLPINAAEINSLKELGIYCSFSRNFCMLAKRMFHLSCHTCTTYAAIFLVMESDRFLYFRQYISAKSREENLENYSFVIYGSIIFIVFPLLLILNNFLTVTILLAGQTRKKVRTILSGLRNTVRIRFWLS